MKGITPVGGLCQRSVKSISNHLGCSSKDVERAAKGETKPGEKPNLRLKAMVERAQRGSFR